MGKVPLDFDGLLMISSAVVALKQRESEQNEMRVAKLELGIA
jgi:hypothetical protein